MSLPTDPLAQSVATLEDLSSACPVEAQGTLRFTEHVGADRVSWHHPGARASLSLQMMAHLARGVAERLKAPGGPLWVRGGDTAFCAGAYLPQMRWVALDEARMVAFSSSMHTVLQRLYEGPRLVVAHTDLPAVGGGAELLTACNLRFLGPGCKVRFVQVQRGIATGWGGASRLARQIPGHWAHRWLLGGEWIDAHEAARVGWAEVATEHEVDAWLVQQAERSPSAVQALKGQMHSSPDVATQVGWFRGEEARLGEKDVPR